MDVLIDEAVKLLGGVLAAAAVAVLIKLLQKFGLQVDEAREAKLRSAAYDAVQRVEEKAAALIKSKARKVIPSAEKMELAVAHVVAKIPNVTEAEAREVVEATLPQVGLGAAAGVKALGKAVRTRK